MLVFINGCVDRGNSITDSFCESKGYSSSRWVESFGTNHAFYCVKEVRSETRSHCDYYVISENSKHECYGNETIERVNKKC